MTTDPTTPEGRAELRKLYETADLGTLEADCCSVAAIVYDEHGNSIFSDCFNDNVAELAAAAVNALPALLDALDDAECDIERQRGDLVIERRRANAAEDALAEARVENARLLDMLNRANASEAQALVRLDAVRVYAREQRRMAEELHSIDRPYEALPFDNTATALERKIGDRT